MGRSPTKATGITLYFVLECKVMAQATISSKNQIVIPREAREALGLKAGDKVLVVVRGKRVLVLQKPRSNRAAIRGLAGSAYPSRHLHEERQSWE